MCLPYNKILHQTKFYHNSQLGTKAAMQHTCKLDEARPLVLVDTPTSPLHERHIAGVSASCQNPVAEVHHWWGRGGSKASDDVTLRHICC